MVSQLSWIIIYAVPFGWIGGYICWDLDQFLGGGHSIHPAGVGWGGACQRWESSSPLEGGGWWELSKFFRPLSLIFPPGVNFPRGRGISTRGFQPKMTKFQQLQQILHLKRSKSQNVFQGDFFIMFAYNLAKFQVSRSFRS